MSLDNRIIWLAAYPKAGSSWVRIIIHELLGLNGKLRDELPTFGKAFPLNPPVYRIMQQEAKLVRTHFHPLHPKFQSAKNQQALHTIGVITVRRHPLDVLLSQLNYAYIRKRQGAFIDGDPKAVAQILSDGQFDQYMDRFAAAGGCPERLGRCGRYADFYDEWGKFELSESHLDLRYETMVANPLGALRDIASFLRLPLGDAESLLMRVEQRTQLDGQFFWRKRAYNYREMLSEATIARFETAFAKSLGQLCY